jgi:hypothetical protein
VGINASWIAPLGAIQSAWQVSRCGPTLFQWSLTAAIPAGSTAALVIDVREDACTLTNAVIQEAGRTVWSQGQFHPGVPGITAGPPTSGSITLTLSSGTFNLNVSSSTAEAQRA